MSNEPKPIQWGHIGRPGYRFPKLELTPEPKAIRETLKRQRKSHTVKVSQGNENHKSL